MKKLYMHTIISSSGKECVLIILFQLRGWAGLFENNLLWVGQYEPLNLHIAKELIQY